MRSEIDPQLPARVSAQGPTRNRRTFLTAAGAAVVGTTLAGPASWRAAGAAGNPFGLGVASGDPLPHAVVIWTRVVRDLSDPTGGLGRREIPVRWEVATDPRMRRVVRRGTATARAAVAHTVHVDVRGLDPGRTYWYRFRALGAETDPARTRTAPAPNALPSRFTLAQVSCQRLDHGSFAAYADLTAARPDLVVHLGDYIYEYPVTFGQALTEYPTDLAGYRLRYQRYKQDPELQAAHAIAPFVVTWDDHEVENNYTGAVAQATSTTPGRAAFLARRAAAYRAWWEHQPVRLARPVGPDLRIHRRIGLGRLAALHVLDTRQFRSDQFCSTTDIGPRCEGADSREFTVLGRAQERWLGNGLQRPRTRWSILANQVVMQQWRFAPGDAAWNLDQWDGYPNARSRLLRDLAAARSTPVVLTGDVHSSWVGSLARDLDDPDSAPIGTEFVGPAVSSAPSALLAGVIPTVLQNSPHLRWAEGQSRGWVRHDITPSEWQADYRFSTDPFDPTQPTQTAKRFRVDRRSRLTEG